MDGSQGTPIVVSEGFRHIFWLKAPGDHVKAGDSVASMEAGKGTTFVAAPVEGTLGDIVVPTGSTTKSNEPIGFILP